jgi:hypothetical protein
MKTENFYTSKETITRVKRNIQIGRKHLNSYSMNKGLVIRINEEIKKLNIKSTNTPMKKWANEHKVLRSTNS